MCRRVGATKKVKNWFNMKGEAHEICRFRTFQNQEGKVNYELMSIPFSVSLHKKTFWHREKKKKDEAKSSLFFLNVVENLGLKRFPKTKQSKLMKIIFKPNATAVRRFFVALVDLNVDESLFAFFLLIEPQDFFQSRFRWRLRYKKKRWKQLIEFCRGLKPEPKDLYISSVSRWFFSLDSLGVTLVYDWTFFGKYITF